MALAFKRIKVYVRLIVLVAVALAVGMLVFQNRSHTATVWFISEYQDVSVLWLTLCVGLGSIVVYWLMGTVVRLRRDMRHRLRRHTPRLVTARQLE